MYHIGLCLLIVFIVSVAAKSEILQTITGSSLYQDLFITQNIDHFNARNSRTFQQRYRVDASHWTGNGPIFFYAGNEGPLEQWWENTGFVFDIAPQFGALVIFGEHRYYGQTLPFGNASFDGDNVGYLSVEQAMADYATLIESYKDTHNITVPVVVFGGSYGGMLAFWLRVKYPHIFHAALAASAPILLPAGVPPTLSFFDSITQVFAQVDSRCPDLVRRAFSEVITLGHQQAGRDQLQKQFNTCQPIKNQADVAELIMWAKGAFDSLAMANYPYPSNLLGPLPGFPMKAACYYMTNTTTGKVELLDGFKSLVDMVYNASGTVDCHNLYAEYVDCADQTGCGVGFDGFAWDYQACSEIIYYPQTNNQTDMFPPHIWNLDLLTKHCESRWGITPREGWIRTLFGGASFTDTTRVIFSNGLLDPWHGGGVLTNLSESLIAIIIELGAHHLDLRSSNPLDPDCVVKAREQEVYWIKKWISEIRVELGLNW